MPSDSPVEDTAPVLAIKKESVRRRRATAQFMRAFCWVAVTIALVGIPGLGVLTGNFDKWAGSEPWKYFVATIPPVALMIYAAESIYNAKILRTNRVSINEKGFYPPTKPTKMRIRGDWYVPYSQIKSMAPTQSSIAARLGYQHAFKLELVDGTTFDANVVELFDLAPEPELKQVARALGVIAERVRERRAGGVVGADTDLRIPREEFFREKRLT